MELVQFPIVANELNRVISSYRIYDGSRGGTRTHTRFYPHLSLKQARRPIPPHDLKNWSLCSESNWELLSTNQLFYPLNYMSNGADGWTRTSNARYFTPPLYHWSYISIWNCWLRINRLQWTFRSFMCWLRFHGFNRSSSLLPLLRSGGSPMSYSYSASFGLIEGANPKRNYLLYQTESPFELLCTRFLRRVLNSFNCMMSTTCDLINSGNWTCIDRVIRRLSYH